MQLNESQRLTRALRHRHESTHAQLGDFGRAMNLAAHAGCFGNALGSIGQHGGRGMVCRTIGPLTRNGNTFLLSHSGFKCGADGSGLGLHAQHHFFQTQGLGLRFGMGISIGNISHGLHCRA